ncbi:MAG TPA: enoyl-CoA hydratase-related protein [Casimicrobiaceae bacterium]|jgi:2-(1,2-epoxy-1,2-dihydrophenyl)acetyl-CoA isomerase
MADTLLVERMARVATVTLNRVEALNALDFAMMDALVANMALLAADESLRVIVLCGAGAHFMAGGDVHAFAQDIDEAPSERQARFQRLIGRLHAAIELIRRMPHPVIARVQGAVAGFGLSLMCACDLVVAAEDAYFTSAYRQLALTPDGGLTFALPRIVGLRKAMEILLLSERFDAAEASRLGLVNKVVPLDELDATVAAWARSLESGPTQALRNAKRLARQSLDHTLSEQLQAEATSFAQCAATPEFVEGVRAFVAKRKPRF